MSRDIYKIKRIKFLGSTRSILTQSVNGPCPLLAISNVLLLRNQLDIPIDQKYVTFEQLVTCVANLILTFNKGRRDDPNFTVAAASSLDVLPKLNYGLDVNCCFSDCKTFEYTGEVAIFDLLDITLLHGWVVSTDEYNIYNNIYNINIYNAVYGLYYNQITQNIVKLHDIKEKFIKDTHTHTHTRTSR
eukprot:GHVR01106078.1.p1 GENE.GHVR01106078.1~~GHVR01106078.1.p1  ORF type:complete len:188 (-),score=54.26 GHVR01106078.1:71-634(-)